MRARMPLSLYRFLLPPGGRRRNSRRNLAAQAGWMGALPCPKPGPGSAAPRGPVSALPPRGCPSGSRSRSPLGNPKRSARRHPAGPATVVVVDLLVVDVDGEDPARAFLEVGGDAVLVLDGGLQTGGLW